MGAGVRALDIAQIIVVFGSLDQSYLEKWNSTGYKSILVNNNPFPIEFNILHFPNIIEVVENRNHNFIAGALNIGIRKARELNFSFYILLDCDAYLTKRPSCILFEYSRDRLVQCRSMHDKSDSGYLNYFTSGTILSDNIYGKIGEFSENLKIDSVDTDFALRAKRKGIMFFKSDDVYQQHKLGYSEKNNIFNTPMYSMTRYFYQFRNWIIISFKFFDDKLIYVLALRKAKYFLRIIFLEFPIRVFNGSR